MSADPILSADFAERVLARADVVIARRRRVRNVLAGVVVVSFVSVGAASWMMMSGGSKMPAMNANPQSVAFAETNSQTAAQAQSGEPDVMSYFFPDAPAVASFAAEYSNATYGSDNELFSYEDPTS